MSRVRGAAVAVTADPRAAPLVLRIGWLAVMGAIFFSTYGAANWLASRRAHVPTFTFGWEHSIPFVPWTIVPYWSIDLLYVLSFFFWMRRDDLLDHVKRLLFVQAVSVACFIAWPLRFGFDRPEAGGWAGALFTLLMGFDKPFNQAPSLHIGLLVVLWAVYAARLRGGVARTALHWWAALIGVSVLTTYQHHAIDVPTGALVGCVALFLFPLREVTGLQPWMDTTPTPATRRLARRYAWAALVFAGAAYVAIPNAVGSALLAGWVALALACTAWIYWRGAPKAFQKNACGRMPPFILLLFAPTIAGAFVNSRLWTWNRPSPVRIDATVSIGRIPTSASLRRGGFDGVVDLTAEMPRWVPRWILNAYASIPQLDLSAPSPSQLQQVVDAIQRQHDDGRRILMHCALGYGRSVLCAAAWIAVQHGLRDAVAALEAVRAAQPRAVWSDESVDALQRWMDEHVAMPRVSPS